MKKIPSGEVYPDVESRIKKLLARENIERYVEKVEYVRPGFINFFLSKEFLFEAICELAESLPVLDVGQKKRVILEFVSANPTGPLTVAHGRQAAVGDSLKRILKFVGYDVDTHYYLNDEGTQIDLLGQSLKVRIQECEGHKDVIFPEGGYQGAYLEEVARTAYQEGISSQESIDFFSRYAMRIIQKQIESQLESFGVSFDTWVSQRDIHQRGLIAEVLEKLHRQGVVYSKENAVWFKATEFGDDKDRVLVKSDGSYTYLAPDIAYHYLKFKEQPYLVVNLWGPDHHGYIKRIKASVEALGFNSTQLKIIIVQHVSLIRNKQKISMSTRQGTFISLEELLNDLGKDAVRFFYILRRVSSPLEFDIDLARKKSRENPVFYVQYAYARIQSIFRKIDDENIDIPLFLNSFFEEKEEQDLARTLLRFPYVLLTCARMLDPYFLAEFLISLANIFHLFYERRKIIGSTSEVLVRRTILAKAVKNILEIGLCLLGVSRPEKM